MNKICTTDCVCDFENLTWDETRDYLNNPELSNHPTLDGDEWQQHVMFRNEWWEESA